MTRAWHSYDAGGGKKRRKPPSAGGRKGVNRATLQPFLLQKCTIVRQDTPSFISDSGYVLRLLVCLGALLALRLVAVHVSAIDLVTDEAQYWTWSRDLDFGYFSKPPLIAWIIRGVGEICGQSEACIRSASPVLYTLASQMMTTDVPLILMWTVMLYLWVMLVKRPTMAFAILLGIALGIGLLAKQAMIYAALCAACHAAVSREARDALKGGRGLVAVLIALALFSPNIVWNAQNDFPTAKHTGANISWQYPYIHPLQLLEYVGVQFGVFGPILLVVLVRAAWREIRGPRDQNKVLLLAFSLPMLALLLVQALMSRAHGNWSATAYPAATIFVTAVMLQLDRQVLFRVSLALHLVIAVMVAAVPAFGRQWPVFEQLRFLRSTLGWRDVAGVVRVKLAEDHYGALLVRTRDMAAEMLYYLGDSKVPLVVWAPGPEPHDHYQMTRPFTADTPEPILFVSLKGCPPNITGAFTEFELLGIERVALIKAQARNVHFCRLAGYKGDKTPAP